MRITRSRTTSAALAAGVALAAGTACGADASAPATTAAKAHLRVSDLTPPAVRGTGFRRHERVTVTLTSPASGQRVRHPHTTGTGSFSVVFRHAKVGRCGGFTVRAVDASGHVAVLHRLQPRCIVE